MCLYLLKEDEMVPWMTALSHLQSWAVLFRESSGLDKINKFILHVIEPIYTKLGWGAGGDHVQKYVLDLTAGITVTTSSPA